ncbi:MAG TPA: FecR domain-containing protein [Chitinophagaceae bacterium]|nr:FecR domain-containing protein [Chitinophagaceae bacterium]
MPNNKIWDLIAKKLSGEASPEELTELENLLKAHPDMHYPMQTVADLWHHTTPDTEDAHQAFARHNNRMTDMGIGLPADEQPLLAAAEPRPRKYLLPALGLLLVLVAGYACVQWWAAPAKSLAKATDKSEISTKHGSRTKLQLPDGTQVWLNAGSKLSYDKTYGNNLREVSLSGEAFFDVVKNAAHPFVIHTSAIDIKVLGTAFNVKSFPGEKNTETSLLRGSIEVSFHNRPAEKIILKPNEKLITANEDTLVQANTHPIADKKTTPHNNADPAAPLVLVSHLSYTPVDSTIIETSWMENKLIFRSETFEDLAIRMERWYGVTIRFADDAIKPKKLNGTFENETIQQALKALQLVTPFEYSINKNDIVIASKK